MPCNLISIRHINLEDHACYFFDTGVWLHVLNQSAGNPDIGNLSYKNRNARTFVDWFEAVVELGTKAGTKEAKYVKQFVKIVMTPLLMSEIINAYLRNVSMPLYCHENGRERAAVKFKPEYRTSTHYQKQLNYVLGEMEAYASVFEYRNDRFDRDECNTVFKLLSANWGDNDFNDCCYCNLLQGTGIPIISLDADYRKHTGLVVLVA